MDALTGLSERLVLKLAPGVKQLLESEARASGKTTSAYVRDRLNPNQAEEQVASALFAQINASLDSVVEGADRTLRIEEETLAKLEADEEQSHDVRRQIRANLASLYSSANLVRPPEVAFTKSEGVLATMAREYQAVNA